MPVYKYEFTRTSYKQFKKLSPDAQQRIITKLDKYCQSGKPLAFAHQLIDFRLGTFRFRMGDCRVIFDIDQQTLVIQAVGHRREIYL
jgi:mRNA interferase RelE/StbE